MEHTGPKYRLATRYGARKPTPTAPLLVILALLGSCDSEDPAQFPSLNDPAGTDITGGTADGADDDSDGLNRWNLPGGGLAGNKADAELTDDDTQEECVSGAIHGVFCALDLPEGQCLNLSATLNDCHGNPVDTPTTIAVGGAFDIPKAPLGIASLTIQGDDFTYVCEVVVQPDVTANLNPAYCVCDSESCPFLSTKPCDASVLDNCNCQDDDCDGDVDENCADICNCQDDDCDGLVDEECLDTCDCADNDCDGVIDEDCGDTSTLPAFSSEFLSICDGTGVCKDGSTPTECLPLASCAQLASTNRLVVDCNQDGVPDECPVCPPIELVVLIDISGSMEEEFFSLCESIPLLFNLLTDAGVTYSTEVYALGSFWTPDAAAWPELKACLGSSLHDTYGPNVMPSSITTFDSLRLDTEGWATGIAAVAKNKPWREDTLRLIVPVSDESPIWGDPFDKQDQLGIDFAVQLCQTAGVTVAPLVGYGASSDVLTAAAQFADKTGGLIYATGTAADLTAHALATIVSTRCALQTDCDLDQTPDLCQISPSTDKNNNFVLDTCE